MYDVLKSLTEKGFVVQHGKKLRAVPLKAALESRRIQFKSQFQLEDQMRENAAQRLSGILDARKNTDSTGVREPTLLHGIPAIASTLLEVVPQATQVFLMLRRAFEAAGEMRLIARQLAPETQLSIKVLIPESQILEETDHELIGRFNAEVRKTQGFLLDMMVTDKHDVMIGLPDPAIPSPTGVIGLYLRDQGFALSLMNSIRNVWEAASPVPGY